MKWSHCKGWEPAAKHTFCGANGIQVSPDKKWMFVSEWGARRLWKFSVSGHLPAKQIELDFLPDDLRWSDNGTLVVAGQFGKPSEIWGCDENHGGCPMKFAIAEIDPVNFKSQRLLISGDKEFGPATVAIKTASDLWVGSFRGKKVAKYSKLTPIANNNFSSNQNTSSTPISGSNNAAQEGTHRMNIRIIIGNKTMLATLEDNDTARDFAALLPLNLTLRDFSAAEKVSDALAKKLSEEGAPSSAAGAVGDIAYYAPWRNIAFYRGRGPHAPGVIKIGKITSDIEVLEQPGNASIKISRAD